MTVQDLQPRSYAEASRRGWAQGDVRLPRIAAGPDAASEVAAMLVRCRAQRHYRLHRAGRNVAALRAGTILALANKESLWSAVSWSPKPHGRARSPLSTPSTRPWRAMSPRRRGWEVDRLILTASGGPFRGLSRSR